MYKILVCDDDREIVEAIEIYLSQEGYQILKAYDGIRSTGDFGERGSGSSDHRCHDAET